MPKYRPLNPEWPEVADVVSGYVSDVLAGQASAEQAMEEANKELTQIYQKAGYLS